MEWESKCSSCKGGCCQSSYPGAYFLCDFKTPSGELDRTKIEKLIALGLIKVLVDTSYKPYLVPAAPNWKCVFYSSDRPCSAYPCTDDKCHMFLVPPMDKTAAEWAWRIYRFYLYSLRDINLPDNIEITLDI
jgi:hypothetical protein